MKKINIHQLKNGRWKVEMTVIRRIYNSPETAYNAVERNIKAFFVRTKQQKTSVKVKYDDRSVNESILSEQPHYLLWALSIFMEDYLPQNTVKRAEKKYNHE